MDRAQILARVAATLVREYRFEPARIQPETKLDEELGLDSLDRVELSMALEDEFDIYQLDDKAVEWKTVGAVVDDVAERLASMPRGC